MLFPNPAQEATPSTTARSKRPTQSIEPGCEGAPCWTTSPPTAASSS